MLIQKENLKGVYIWNKENVRIPFTGDASRRVFDRYNGDQMLFVINLYGLLSQTFSIAEGIETENKIMSYMPLEIKSEMSVLQWLKQSNEVLPTTFSHV